VFEGRAVELKGLRDELDELSALDPGALDDESLTAHLVEARRLRDRLDGLIARLGAAYRARGAWAAAGFASAAAHLASLRGEPKESCGADLRLARALVSMPLTAAALAAGSITRAHAERLRIAAAGPRLAAFVEAEAMLVGLAGSLDGHGFERAVRYWAQAADDAAAEAEALRHERDRWCQVDQLLDGRVDVRATMTRTGGAIVASALDRLEKELFHQDWTEAKTRLGRDPLDGELRRTTAQRRHDALVLMAERAMAAPPGARLPAPLLVVHLGGDDAMFGRLCELADGTVITPGEALRLLPFAEIERAIREAPDRVRVSEKVRLFRGAERRAVEIRDRYCTYPGCHVAAEDCEVDHVVPYADGGPTTQENGRLRCAHHHPGRRRSQPWLDPDPGDPGDPDDTS
jgi:hypothetical protein